MRVVWLGVGLGHVCLVGWVLGCRVFGWVLGGWVGCRVVRGRGKPGEEKGTDLFSFSPGTVWDQRTLFTDHCIKEHW